MFRFGIGQSRIATAEGALSAAFEEFAKRIGRISNRPPETPEEQALIEKVASGFEGIAAQVSASTEVATTIRQAAKQLREVNDPLPPTAPIVDFPGPF